MNITALNGVDCLHSAAKGAPFRIFWANGTSAPNRDTLTYTFHHHSFCEVHCILRGRVSYGVGEGSVPVCAGQFIVVHQKRPHRVESCSEDFLKLTVAFEVTDAKTVSRKLDEITGNVYSINTPAQNVINTLFDEAEQKGCYKTERVMHTLYTLLFLLAETVGCTRSEQSAEEAGDLRVTKAKKYIADNSESFFTCEEVARYCHVSVKQLGRLFKQYEGIGLLAFIHKSKTDAAVALLRETELSQKKIAEKLGFSDVRYFGKFIVRMTGQTPSALRASNAEEGV